jgi:hypothetical protein
VRDAIERAAGTCWLDRRLPLFVAVVTATLLPVASQAQPAEQVGSVQDIKGEAFVEVQAQRRNLERAAPLFIRDTVGTGSQSRLTMHLGKDTILRVGAEARVTIDRLLVNAGGEITLNSGPIMYERPAGSNPARMQIRSPYGLIAVRGTRFFAGPSAGVFGVFVGRGSVTVSAAGGRVTLRAGQGTNLAYPGARPTPAATWGSERIRAALGSVE